MQLNCKDLFDASFYSTQNFKSNCFIATIFSSTISNDLDFNAFTHGLQTPNEGINQRNLKIWADVADKISFGRT